MQHIFSRQPSLVFFIVLANLVLSYWCIYNDPVINNDGVTYLAIAQSIIDGEVFRALSYYNWPFYSLFIALVSFSLSINVETAAYLLNTLFAISLCLAFISIVSELSNGDKKITLIACLVILSFPSITKYRPFIIRDFGYLSCYLWSLYFLFRFCHFPTKARVIAWLCFAVLSFLFRFEGILFLLIASYFLIFFASHSHKNKKNILIFASYGLIVFSFTLLIWYLNSKYSSLIKIAQMKGQDIHTLSDLFFANLERNLDGASLNINNFTNFFFAKAGDVFYELLRRLSIFYLPFALFALHKSLTLNNKDSRRIWYIYVTANLLMLLAYSLFNDFLVSRYTLSTALTLLLLAPFGIYYFIQRFKILKIHHKVFFIFSLLLISITSADRVFKTPHKHYIKEAGQWLKETMPSDSSLYSNNKLVVYYAGVNLHKNMQTTYHINTIIRGLNTKSIYGFEYVALDADLNSKVDDEVRQTLSYHYGEPINIFNGKGKKAIYIFKLVRNLYCTDPDRLTNKKN